MKRVKAACLFQTLVFAQKPDCELGPDAQRQCNRDDAEKYKQRLASSGIRYRIVEESEQPDGSVVLKVRKQYSATADVGEYIDM